MSTEKIRIAVIDHDEPTKKVLRRHLDKSRYRIFSAATEQEGISLIKRRNPALIIVNLHLEKSNGVGFLRTIKQINQTGKILALGERSDDNRKETAAKLDVAACLSKPLDPESMKKVIDRLMTDRQRTKNMGKTISCFRPMVGRSENFQNLLKVVKKVAQSSATVLVQGQSGTGKELIARAIHHYSNRHKKPFITVNCAALPDGLLESELFGARQGAFTGATSDRVGKFQLADGGTLVLDEISELHISLQAKLLRMLQEKEVTPLGGHRSQRIDVRVVAITNQDLVKKVKEGKFREDLFYRLNVIPISPPPLRDRKKDIPDLVTHFIERFNAKNERSIKGLSNQTLDILLDYHWPGNIRELENTIEKAVVLGEKEEIYPEDLPTYIVRHVQEEADIPFLPKRESRQSSNPWLALCRMN